MRANYNPVKASIIAFARANGGTGLKFEITGAMQYYKWLSYIPEFMKKNIDEILSKSLSELSSNQLKDYNNFLQEQKMLKQLEQFFGEQWALADIEFIQDFIDKYPLSKIKRARLTDEEYKNIIEEIRKYYGNYSERDIDKISDNFNSFNLKVNGDPKYRKDYYSLSMREAYIYDFKNNLEISQSMVALSTDIKKAIWENNRARESSLIAASKTFTKR